MLCPHATWHIRGWASVFREQMHFEEGYVGEGHWETIKGTHWENRVWQEHFVTLIKDWYLVQISSVSTYFQRQWPSPSLAHWKKVSKYAGMMHMSDAAKWLAEMKSLKQTIMSGVTQKADTHSATEGSSVKEAGWLPKRRNSLTAPPLFLHWRWSIGKFLGGCRIGINPSCSWSGSLLILICPNEGCTRNVPARLGFGPGQRLLQALFLLKKNKLLQFHAVALHKAHWFMWCTDDGARGSWLIGQTQTFPWKLHC